MNRSRFYCWVMAIFTVLCIAPAHAAEGLLPHPAKALFGLDAAPITVVDPERSTPLRPVEVTYLGFPALALLDAELGANWRTADALVGFEGADGYLSMIPAQRFAQFPAYLVYAKADGDDFSVETGPFNQRTLLGPWYLVWDNVMYPALQADGATYWPYQVKRVTLISPDVKQKLFPAMLPERYREGAQLAEKYCLACHQVNGVGSRKLPIQLDQWAATQSFARFATWVLDPSGKNPSTTMPALAAERPAAERQLMARQIYGYLRAMGALGR
ncbi:MAG: hypothetical protein ACOYBR_03160 [Fluviibacter sp.]